MTRFHYERRYPYFCSLCHKKRYTRKNERRANEVCQKCERTKPPQTESLFPLDMPASSSASTPAEVTIISPKDGRVGSKPTPGAKLKIKVKQ